MGWVRPKTYTNPIYPFKRPADQDSLSPVHHNVIIVGAGPIGLTAALDLATRGIPSVILSKEDTVSIGSRALCFSKKTLEVINRLDKTVSQKLLDKGVVWNLGKVFYQKEKVFEFNLLPEKGHKIPAFVNLQQYYFEEYLVDLMKDNPLIDLRWHSTAAFMGQDDGKVTVEVTNPDGTYTLECDYLLACDGVKSSIREAMNLSYEGEFFEENFLIADVVMDGDFPTERWFWFDPPFNKGHSALLHKEPDNVWRIDLQLGREGVDKEKELDQERIKSRLKAMLGTDCKFELEWTSIYNFKCMRMKELKNRRVLFAGDSAHQVSPFGARGANGGVQDIDNLIWKLAYVINGLAPNTLLDSYDEERSPAADENIMHSSNATDFISPKSEMSLRFRNAILDLAKHDEFSRTLINSGRLSTPYRYIHSRLTTCDDTHENWDCSLQPGHSVKDAVYRDGYLVDSLGIDFTLLVWATASQENHLLKILEVNKSDVDLIVKYNLKPESWYLIRPDHHIAARGRAYDNSLIKEGLFKSIGKLPKVKKQNSTEDTFAKYKNDEKYQLLIRAHDGLLLEDSEILNCKLLTLLLEHTSSEVLNQIIKRAKKK